MEKENPIWRQIILRSFTDKYRGIQSGRITAIIVPLNPQPPEGFHYKGKCFNGAELFTDGKGRYFFPVRNYRPGDHVYVREEWAVEYDEEEKPFFLYQAGFSWDHPVLWRTASYMPAEAARFFLQVDSTRVARIQDVGAEDTKAAGARGRGGAQDIRRFWEQEKRKGELGFDENPWVHVIRFHLIPRPEEFPTEVGPKALVKSRKNKSYVVRYAKTGEIAAQGTAADCAKALGFKRPRAVHDLFTRIRRGINKTYTVETVEDTEKEE